jgi:hypothetical protein
MPVPVFETLVGAVNDFNTVFYTAADYVPGSVRVVRNGLLGSAPLTDGWYELGGKKLQLKEAPITGDVMRAYYLR